MSESYFNEGEELLEWGPVPGVLLSGSLFIRPFMSDCMPLFNSRWPRTLLLFKNKKFVWLNGLEELKSLGELVFAKYVLAENWRNEFNKVWAIATDDFRQVMQKIEEADLSSLTNDELAELVDKFQSLAATFESPTVVPELANFGADRYLRNILKNKIPDDKWDGVFSELCAPETLSFNHREEIELLETHNVARHRQKYYWLQNGFGKAHEIPVSEFEQRKRGIRRTVRDDGEKMIEKIRSRKRAIQDEYALSEKTLSIAREIWLTVVMQDERKIFNYMGVHYGDVLAREVGRRFDYSHEDLLNAWINELVDIIKGEDMREKLISRREGYGVEFGNKMRELSSQQVKQYWMKYVDKDGIHDQQELRGTVACQGNGKKVTGRVRVIDDPRDAGKFQSGDILVAVMTSPDFVVAMRKASAIVTNYGGLTSHAAIVSRELNIPCIIGTKIATIVLKDGDMVEVDADRGIVKKL